MGRENRVPTGDGRAAALDRYRRPLRDLRISVTDRCNLRCSYCLPSEAPFTLLQREQILRFDEILRLARLFIGLGVRKIRLTGGEPLLRKDLPDLVGELAALPGLEDLGLTTNGLLLAEQAPLLAQAGLGRLTVSLDSLNRHTFHRLTGHDGLPQVLAGLERAMEVGFSPLRINAVVIKGTNENEVVELLSWALRQGHVLRFIEYMDAGGAKEWSQNQVISAQWILEQLASRFSFEPLPGDEMGRVARNYRVLDEAGEFGIIASISEPFCGGCTRARLSADGKLYTCLFAGKGLDLKEPLRRGASDGDLEDLLLQHWSRREDRYSELRQSLQGELRLEEPVPMRHIGG
jgi:cyclic pyranopterin phosphate synthase